MNKGEREGLYIQQLNNIAMVAIVESNIRWEKKGAYKNTKAKGKKYYPQVQVVVTLPKKDQHNDFMDGERVVVMRKTTFEEITQELPEDSIWRYLLEMK